MDDLQAHHDVVVVGGGAAGLSGALTLARARRSVAVIDAGRPRNAPADAVHGLLGLEGVAPAVLLERGRAEARGYGAAVVDGEVASARPQDGGFVVDLADGRTTQARRLLVTTGLEDELPTVDGLGERWGRDVLHCPYCHGWEVRDRPLGVISTGPLSVHQALTVRQWSDDVILFGHLGPEPDADQMEQLDARDIALFKSRVRAVEVGGDRLSGVRLEDGTVVAREVLFVAPRMRARADFLVELGLTVVDHPAGVGAHVATEPGGRTTAAGVWAAGNVTDVVAQVGTAASAGSVAAQQINADLVAEDTRRAVARVLSPFTARSEARVAELVAGNRRHGL